MLFDVGCWVLVGDAVAATCNCRYYSSNFWIRHIWRVLLPFRKDMSESPGVTTIQHSRTTKITVSTKHKFILEYTYIYIYIILPLVQAYIFQTRRSCSVVMYRNSHNDFRSNTSSRSGGG